MYRYRNAHHGFSLIELVVVISVLSVLILMAVPVFSSYVETVEKTVCDANCLQLQKMYHANSFVEAGLEKIEFAQFLQDNNEETCPRGEVVFLHDEVVKCPIHSMGESGEDDDNDNGGVPYL